MDKQLRLLAGEIIVESEMTKASKLQLLNFIKEDATDAQVKALLMDGKIVQLDEQAEEIVNDRFNSHPIQKTLVNEGVLKSIFGMFLLTPAGWIAWRAIKALFSKGERRCGVLAIGKTRDLCMLRLKLTIAKRKLQIISSNLSNCSNAKNPAKCKTAGQTKMAKFNDEISMLNGRLKDMQQSGLQQAHKQSNDGT